MTETTSDKTLEPAGPIKSRTWNWHPELPLGNSPLFAWPWDVRAIARHLAGQWLTLSQQLIFVGLAVVAWLYLNPAMPQGFGAVGSDGAFLSWIGLSHLRNLALMALVAGGLHLYLITWKHQGLSLKYDGRDQARDSTTHTFGNQVHDNIFWTLASGVTVWTLYEAIVLLAQADGWAPLLTWADSPVWFVLLFLLIPIWNSGHFYFVHRLLHWPPLYRAAHALHHRNVNVGPWSGLSMHPIEHAIYLTSVFIHLVVPSHPIHIFFHMYWLTLAAATSHAGFDGILVKHRNRLALGFFHHQLHHRYFECNYGNGEFPWDKWFGSFHDGTPEATKRMRQKRRGFGGA